MEFDQSPYQEDVCKDPLGATEGLYGYRLAPLDDKHWAYIYHKQHGVATDIAYITPGFKIGPLEGAHESAATGSDESADNDDELAYSCYLGIADTDGAFEIMVKDPRVRTEDDLTPVLDFYVADGVTVTRDEDTHYFGIANSLYDITPSRRITSKLALAVFVYLIWGRPTCSIMPLEYDRPFGLEVPFTHLEDVLARQYSNYKPTPQFLDAVKHVFAERDRIARKVRDNIPLENGERKFMIQRGPNDAFFSCIPTDGRGYTTYLVDLFAELNTAFIADAMLQDIEDETFRESPIMAELAKSAAYRRIAKRSSVPPTPDVRDALVQELDGFTEETFPHKGYAYLFRKMHRTEIDARMELGAALSQKILPRMVFQRPYALNLTSKEAVLDFELPPAHKLPEYVIDPDNPGELQPATKEQQLDAYYDYVCGLAILFAKEIFDQVFSLDRVVINGYAPEPNSKFPTYAVVPAMAHKPKYVLSADFSREVIGLASSHYVSCPQYLLTDEEYGAPTKYGCLDPDAYHKKSDADLEPSLDLDQEPLFETITPYLTPEELNKKDLRLPNKEVDDLFTRYPVYEPTLGEMSTFKELDLATDKAWDILNDGDEDTVQDAYLHLKRAAQRNQDVIAKFLSADKNAYRSFPSTVPYLLYIHDYDLPENALLMGSELADFLYVTGVSAMLMEDYQEAFKAFFSGLTLSPGEAVFYLEIAWICFKLEDFETAKVYLKEAEPFVYHEPDVSRIYCYYGLYAQHHKRYTEAALYLLRSKQWADSPVADAALEEIKGATGKANGGVTQENHSFLLTQFGIPDFPLKSLFDVLNHSAELFVNTRDFPRAEEVLKALLPMSRGQEVLDILSAIPLTEPIYYDLSPNGPDFFGIDPPGSGPFGSRG